MSEEKIQAEPRLELTVPTDFKINYKPAVISFDGYDELAVRVKHLVDSLNGYQVTAASYGRDKKLRAELNKTARELHDRGKHYIDLASQETNKFNDSIKVLVNEIKSTSKQIDDGIKYYDNKVKQDKCDRNTKQIAKLAQEVGIDPSAIEYNERWDNKSYSFTTMTDEVKAQLDQLVKDKQLRDDAVKVIQSKADELIIGSQPFISAFDRGESLAEILPKMTDYRQEIDKAVARQKANKAAFEAQQEVHQEVHGNKVINADTGQIVDELVVVKFAVRGTKQQLQSLGRFIKENGIQVTKI